MAGTESKCMMACLRCVPGRPDFGVDFGDIKPKALVVAAAAVLLVMGKPLSGSKTFGNVVLRPPQLEHDLLGTVRATDPSHPAGGVAV